MAYFDVDKDFYLKNKLASLKNDPAFAEEWANRDEAALEAFFAGAGLTVQQHFDQYGWAEGLSANATFDVAKYLSAKAALLNEAAFEGKTDWTSADVAAAFQAAGLTVEEHFTQYGEAEGLKAEPVSTTAALTEALATLKAAQEAKSNFLSEVDGDDDADTSATEDELEEAVEEAASAVADLLTVAGGESYVEAASTVQAALVAEQEKANAKNVAAKEKAVADANAEIAKVTGLKQAIAKLQAATDAAETAEKAVDTANANLAGAEAAFNKLNEEITVGYELTEEGKIDAVTPDTLFKVDTSGSKVVLLKGITEKDYPGITALLNALNTAAAAEAAKQVADNTLELAQSNVVKIEDQDGDTPLADALKGAQAELKLANKAVQDLSKAVAEQAAAEANVAKLAELEKAIEAAEKYFTDNELELPIVLDGLTTATAETDIFVVADADATISGFGFLGEDKLFIGSSFTLNTGALKDGDASVLEVFFLQDGNNTKVVLETKAYGSTEAGVPEIEITLTGVKATDLTLTEEGFVTLA